MADIQSSSNKIKKLYDNLTYFDQYGNSVFIFLFLTILVLFIQGYCNVMTKAAYIQSDWINQRCNPTVIPFAGFINKPPNKTISEFTFENFNQCTQSILIPVTVDATNPFSYIIQGFQAVFLSIATAIENIRVMFNQLRVNFAKVATDVMARILNFIIPVQQLVIAVKDTMAKVSGVMTATLYTSLGSYYTLKSLLGAIVQLSIIILVALIVVMIFTFAFIPFLLPLTMSISIFCAAVSIPLLVIILFLTQVLGIQVNGSIPSIPSIPSCFDKDTKIQLFDGTYKSIYEISIGEKINDGGQITAKLELSANGIDMYSLHDTIVSGCHKVKYNNKWICVNAHPDAILLHDYSQKSIYCLNTTTKVIVINKDIYIDWDEMYTYVGGTEESLEGIHKDYDGGFAPKTPIVLFDKRVVDIKDVQVMDVLMNGEKVYGIVEIDGTNVSSQYLYCDKFIGGPNIYFDNQVNKIEIKQNMEPKLYHLLTYSKTFCIGNRVKIHDYNYSIDKLLNDSHSK